MPISLRSLSLAAAATLLAALALALLPPSPAGAVIVPVKSIAGVSLGQKESAVVKKLGRSYKRRKDGNLQYTLVYVKRGLEVRFKPKTKLVTGIQTTSKKDRTSDGIGPGVASGPAVAKLKVAGYSCSSGEEGNFCMRFSGRTFMTFYYGPETILNVFLSRA